MKSTKTKAPHCAQCGYQLRLDWLGCPNCGSPIEESLVSCARCHHLIRDSEPSFCPYCLHSIGQPPFVSKIRTTMPAADAEIVKEHEEPVVLMDTLLPVRKSHIKGCLRFDRESTFHIMNSKRFTLVALQLILLSAISSSFVLVLTTLLFEESRDEPYSSIVKAFFLVFTVMTIAFMSIAFFAKFILSAIGIDVKNEQFLRYTGMLAVVFLAKDLTLIPMFIYIRIFEGTDGDGLAVLSFTVMTGMALVFMTLHFLVLLRNVSGSGVFMSLVITIMIYGMAALTATYTGYLVDSILELLLN